MLGPVFARASLLAMLSDAVDTGEEFDACKIALFEDTEPIAPGTLIADLTPASYGGYANSAAVVWQTPHLDTAGNAVVQCLPKEFKPTDSTASSTVRQVGLVNTGGTTIKASYMLDEAIIFGTPDDVHLIGFPLILGQPAVELEQIVP